MTDITQFNMQDVQKRVSETIKANFAMLIPEEAFNHMCRAAIEEFMTQTDRAYTILEKRETWGSSATSSIHATLTPFKILLWTEVHALVKEGLAKFLKEHKEELEKKISAMFESDEKKTLESYMNMDVSGLAMDMAKTMHQELMMNAVKLASGYSSQLHTRINELIQHNNLIGGQVYTPT